MIVKSRPLTLFLFPSPSFSFPLLLIPLLFLFPFSFPLPFPFPFPFHFLFPLPICNYYTPRSKMQAFLKMTFGETKTNQGSEIILRGIFYENSMQTLFQLIEQCHVKVVPLNMSGRNVPSMIITLILWCFLWILCNSVLSLLQDEKG